MTNHGKHIYIQKKIKRNLKIICLYWLNDLGINEKF